MKRRKSGQNRMSFDLSQGLLGNMSCLCAVALAPVVQTLDSAIHRINHYPAGAGCSKAG